MNMVNMPKRPEISVKEFETALGLKAMCVIEFDAETFGQAANNGQMIEELSAKAKAAAAFRDIALAMTHRREAQTAKWSSPLAPLLERLKLKL
jgi:pilus assembly protein CpaE